MSEEITMFAEPETLTLADRSTLETAAECPRKARFIETGRVLNTSRIMEVGNAVHSAISATITEYVESRGSLNTSECQDFLLQQLASSRPDIQPEVISAAKSMGYPLGKYLNDLHWENIRCWDGGRGEKSSQLAYDLSEFGLRVTSELDLLHDSESPEIITEVDFKSGFQRWDHVQLLDAFQFQLHAVLILKKFPDIKAVQVKIWNTRWGGLTYPVLFKRESIYNYEFRIREAAAAYFGTRNKTAEDCRAWPLTEKCGCCPAAAICDCSGLPESSPEDIVDKIVALESQSAALSKFAAQYVRQTGQDISTKLGNVFGTNKPKRHVAPKMTTYTMQNGRTTDESGQVEDA